MGGAFMHPRAAVGACVRTPRMGRAGARVGTAQTLPPASRPPPPPKKHTSTHTVPQSNQIHAHTLAHLENALCALSACSALSFGR